MKFQDLVDNIKNLNTNATKCNADIESLNNSIDNLESEDTKINNDISVLTNDVSDLNSEVEKITSKSQPILNITDFGVVPNSGDDISPILNNILSTYDTAHIKFKAGTYFIDCITNNGVIGNSFDKSFTFSSDGGKAIIYINSYVGGDTSLVFKGDIAVTDLIFDGMTKEAGVTVDKNLNTYFQGIKTALRCEFRNFNGNLIFSPNKRVLIKDNIFRDFVDHAIYVRQTLDDYNSEQELIVKGNTFIGNEKLSYYYGESANNPRHAIKLSGRLNKVTITDNFFKCNFGDIHLEQNEEGQLLTKDLEISGNTFYSSYKTIALYGSSYTSAINFDSRVLIYNNKFFNNEELGITGLDLPTGSGISIGKGINWDKLDIRNNIFDMAVNGEVITATGYDLIKQRKVCVDNNSFKNCYIYLEKLDSEISFNTIDSCNNFLMKVDSSHTNVFTSNILNNCTGITDMSCVYKSVLRLSNNTFINCNDLVKSKTYAYGFMWVNNTFEKCTNIFNISLATGKDSISGDFVFFNNTLQESTIADIVNQSLVDRVNIMQNIEYDGTSWRTLQLTTTV